MSRKTPLPTPRATGGSGLPPDAVGQPKRGWESPPGTMGKKKKKKAGQALGHGASRQCATCRGGSRESRTERRTDTTYENRAKEVAGEAGGVVFQRSHLCNNKTKHWGQLASTSVCAVHLSRRVDDSKRRRHLKPRGASRVCPAL